VGAMKRWPLRVALVMLALLVVALFAAWWHHTYKRVDMDGTFHTLWSGDRSEISS